MVAPRSRACGRDRAVGDADSPQRSRGGRCATVLQRRGRLGGLPASPAVLVADVLGLSMRRTTTSGSARIVVIVYMATNVLNFLLVALVPPRDDGFRLWSSGAPLYLTMLPSEIATALLTATSPSATCQLGIGAVGARRRRAGRLPVPASGRGSRRTSAARSSPSARASSLSLQVGLLSTVMQTLSMRDAMTARHSAAVARYCPRGRPPARPRRARAGPRPHGRAAARHRQVHLS